MLKHDMPKSSGAFMINSRPFDILAAKFRGNTVERSAQSIDIERATFGESDLVLVTWLAMNTADDAACVRVIDRGATYRRVIVKAANSSAVRIVPLRTKHHPWRSNCAERVLRLIDQK
jgi:hypothetical protein